jgi:uncharacterized membrane protein
MSVLSAVLVWLHIFSAVGWFGGLLTFRLVMTPLMPKFSAPTRGELVMKLFPNFVKTVVSFAGMTGLFGILLALVLSYEEPAMFSVALPRLTVGASLALAVFLLGLFVSLPSVNKMSKLLSEMQAKGEKQPPPEFGRLQKRVGRIANIGVAFLILTLVFMVLAAEL